MKGGPENILNIKGGGGQKIKSMEYILTLNSNAQYIEPKSCVLATVYGNCHPHHHRRICLKGHALHLQMQDSIDSCCPVLRFLTQWTSLACSVSACC